MSGRIKLLPPAIMLAAALLVGCASEEEDIQGWMNEQARGMRGQVKPLPEIKPFPVVDYDADVLLSPFSRERLVPEPRAESGSGLKPDLERRREPLEAYPLESLAMVGVLRQGDIVEALIRVDKTIHTVRVGNYMGQDFGVITEIRDNEVILRELVEDLHGDWVERSTSLLLQEQQGGSK